MKPIIKKFLPIRWLRFYSDLKTKNKSTEKIFTEIYHKNYWGKKDDSSYFSGTGTHDENTQQYITVLKNFIKEKNIHTVFEIGCGDFSIMKQVLNDADVIYTGADIVKDLIIHLQKSYSNNQTNFIHFNAINEDEFPSADLCIIRQVLQHLSNAQIQNILAKTKQYNYVIITEHIPLNPEIINGDKHVNGYIRLQNSQLSGVFINQAPFNLTASTLLSYPKNDVDKNGKIVPAVMLTSLVAN